MIPKKRVLMEAAPSKELRPSRSRGPKSRSLLELVSVSTD